MKTQWTRSQIRAARQRPLKPVLENLGYRLAPRRDGNYEVLGMAAEVVIKDHYWVRLDDGTAGNAIDFFVTLQGKSFNETMRLLAQTTP
jgi:hypothetical protein